MIGDRILLKDEYLAFCSRLFSAVYDQLAAEERKFVIGIGGESGSGKSVTAKGLELIFNQQGLPAIVLQLDNYFFLPPKTNHEKRMEDISRVGVGEVNMALLQQHIYDFKNGSEKVEIPLMNYLENSWQVQMADFSQTKILIVEGTYVLRLSGLDSKIFIDRNYMETKQNRIERKRDEISPFIEKVLAIEHAIIRNDKSRADVIIDRNFEFVGC